MEQTKERILQAALDLFSQRGYDAVSVAQIAQAVGIKAPSLYKHYSSKQAIFEAIIVRMNERYASYMSSLQMDGVNPAKDSDMYEQIDLDGLTSMGKLIFSFFLNDEYQAKYRKLLVMEQFHNAELASRYMQQYYEDALAYQSTIFSALIEKGLFLQADPRICALHFFGPAFLLLTLCDAQPERKEEALEMIDAHIRQFALIYTKRSSL